MRFIVRLIRCLFCKHEWEFDRNIYGDEINIVNGKRSWWRCRKCGRYKAMPHLHPEPDRANPEVD